MVLRQRSKRGKVHAANGEQHALGRALKGANRVLDTCHVLPVIVSGGHPGGAGQSNRRYAGLLGGGQHVTAHLCGKRVGCINNMGDALLGDKGRQTVGAAKSSHAGGQRLRFRRFNTARIAENSRNAALTNGAGQRTGLARTPKNQDVYHG